MALEKQIAIDKIEILEMGQLQIREVTRIVEDGKELSSSYRRWALEPGQDISDQPEKVQAVANLLWTTEVVNAFKAMLVAHDANQIFNGVNNDTSR